MNPSTLRGLWIELAHKMQDAYTFKQIAEFFYRYGVINKPENPWNEDYPGTKYDYVMDKISKADNLEEFLTLGVPHIVIDIDIEGLGDVRHLEFLMKSLGYTLTKGGEEHGVPEYELAKGLPEELRNPRDSYKIDLPLLPSSLSPAVKELNENIAAQNWIAAALLSRRITTHAVYIAMKRRGKEALLKDRDGDDLGLGKAIEVCRVEYGLSSQVSARIKAVKWIGDSANHSYYVDIKEADVYACVTGLRLWLEELFHG